MSPMLQLALDILHVFALDLNVSISAGHTLEVISVEAYMEPFALRTEEGLFEFASKLMADGADMVRQESEPDRGAMDALTELEFYGQ